MKYVKLVAYSFGETTETLPREEIDDMLENLMRHHDENGDRMLTEAEYLHPYKQKTKRKSEL